MSSGPAKLIQRIPLFHILNNNSNNKNNNRIERISTVAILISSSALSILV